MVIEGIDCNRTVTYRGYDGSYITIPLKDAQDNPIIHKELTEKQIQDVKKIYDSFLGMTEEMDIINLEEFEIMFMRYYDVEEAIGQWRMISRIFRKYLKEYELCSRKAAMQVIDLAFLYFVNYDFPENEYEKNVILKRIIDYYNQFKKDSDILP